jgi:hypothetical protein
MKALAWHFHRLHFSWLCWRYDRETIRALQPPRWSEPFKFYSIFAAAALAIFLSLFGIWYFTPECKSTDTGRYIHRRCDTDCRMPASGSF